MHCQSNHPNKKSTGRACLIHRHNSVKPFNLGLTRSISMDPIDGGLQAWQGHQFHQGKAQEQWWTNHSLRYQNFALQQNDILSSAFNIRVELCICLYIISCVHMVFMANTIWEYSILTTTILSKTWFLAIMEIPSMLTRWWIFAWGGVEQRIFGPSTAAPLREPKRQLPTGVLWVLG